MGDRCVKSGTSVGVDVAESADCLVCRPGNGHRADPDHSQQPPAGQCTRPIRPVPHVASLRSGLSGVVMPSAAQDPWSSLGTGSATPGSADPGCWYPGMPNMFARPSQTRLHRAHHPTRRSPDEPHRSPIDGSPIDGSQHHRHPRRWRSSRLNPGARRPRWCRREREHRRDRPRPTERSTAAE